MKQKNKFLILDVETVQGLDNKNYPYDIGLIVADRHGTIYDKFSFLINDVYNSPKRLVQKSPFYKQAKYDALLNINHFEFLSAKMFFYIFIDLLDMYKIKQVYAYNANFDKDAINNLYQAIFNTQNEILTNDMMCCIWHLCCQSFMNTNKYRKYAQEKKLTTPSNNVKTSAEVAYKYILQNEYFEEEHTGLQDCEIEYEILLKVIKRKQKYDKSINTKCWQIPQC